MAVSSATPQETLRQIIKARGVLPLFNDVLGAPQSKEEHLAFLLSKYNYEPEQVVYVGDSEVDQKAARNMRCHFIGVGEHYKRFNSKPSKFVNDLNSLSQIVTQIS